MVKNDGWIRRMALERGMIEPFEASQVGAGVVSFGVSSYGYDLRIADEFQIPEIPAGDALDPKTQAAFRKEKTAGVLVPPGSFILARSLEYFRIPRDVIALCFGKSTYARCGVIVNVTPLEPEWEGYITIALNNCGGAPVRIHSNEGIAQVVFVGADEICAVSYADRKGKYQRQGEITTAFVKEAERK